MCSVGGAGQPESRRDGLTEKERPGKEGSQPLWIPQARGTVGAEALRWAGGKLEGQERMRSSCWGTVGSGFGIAPAVAGV